jgi:phage/plasmid-like protein (TIGR03299 family)
MAHEIYTLSDGKKSMAYVGETPWHGLGQQLSEGSPIEVWTREAGLDWTLAPAPVLYLDAQQKLQQYPGKKILVRSDTQEPLSMMGDDYNIVQPAEVLSFYADLVRGEGLALETAGSLRGGRKYWALAKLKRSALIMAEDGLEGYLLLATSCDGSLATTGMFTATRVVCANTLGFAVQEGESGRSRKYVKLPHSTKFDPDMMKKELGLAAGSWEVFIEQVGAMAKRKLSFTEAQDIVVDVFGEEMPPEVTVTEAEWDAAQLEKRAVKQIMHLWNGHGLGSKFKSSKDTAWGLVNATTEYLDHHRPTRTRDARLQRAWFGDSAIIKERMFETCLNLSK